MIYKLLVPVILMIALIGSGCAATSTTPYNPLKVSQDDFYGKIKTIAITEIFFPKWLVHPEQKKEEFQSLMESKLHEAGFSMIPYQQCAGILKQITESMGGYFDPITGEIDQAKLRSIMGDAREVIKAKFNSDAFLYASFEVKSVQVSQGEAKWDGVSEQVGNAFELRRGNVGALSLVAWIEDINGQILYEKRGGIQVRSKFSNRQFIPVPREEILNNKARNAASVNIALNPLAKKP